MVYFAMRVLIGLMWVLHWLPLPVLGRIGAGAGWLVFVLAHSRRHIALTNLRLCFPEMPELNRRQLALQHFQAYLRSVLERGVLWWASEHRLRRLIVVETACSLAQVQQEPTIFLCPHFVSLDVAGVALALDASGCSIYSRQSSPVLDQALRKGRSRFKPTALFSRSDGIKPILRAMRNGLPFFMCPDMDFGAKNAEFIPFFGVPAATLTAPARLAAVTGARVIPVIATALPNYQGWKVEFYSPWYEFADAGIAQSAQRMNRFIEEQILKTPAEYLWTHRRFKTRPSGQPDVYARAVAEPEPAMVKQKGALVGRLKTTLAGLASAAQTVKP